MRVTSRRKERAPSWLQKGNWRTRGVVLNRKSAGGTAQWRLEEEEGEVAVNNV